MDKIIASITTLYKATFGNLPDNITKLPHSGSSRIYYRLEQGGKSCIAAYNTDRKENNAFIYLSSIFDTKGLSVPKIINSDLDNHIYLLEDLGDTQLLDFVNQAKNENTNDYISIIRPMYQKILTDLINIQMKGGEHIDFSMCYPRAEFDEQSIRWDLNYFKYCFLKPMDIFFDEQLLENDINTIINKAKKVDNNYFMFRDFQSRNIMITNNNPVYIDYQGGRKGALQYDLTSLLFESKMNLPFDFREEMLHFYIRQLNEIKPTNADKFIDEYYLFTIIRLLQAFGAYGFRGLIEGKSLFLQSIYPAINNLIWLRKQTTIFSDLPEIEKVILLLENIQPNYKLAESEKLTIHINSFSFRGKQPYDLSGNGGGYVFDCRHLHNPGRYDAYKPFTGKDKIVQDFFALPENKVEIETFATIVFDTAKISIDKYLQRNFKHLTFNFGCTGGQHRSVFMAEKLAVKLQIHYNQQIDVVIHHVEQEKKKK